MAKSGRKGRLAMSMVIPIHKPGPDAVSEKLSSEQKIIILLDFSLCGCRGCVGGCREWCHICTNIDLYE